MPKSDQGLEKKRYSVIPRTLIFIFQEENVLLIKGNVGKNLWAEKYNGLGGHIEAGEDVFSSAYRELEEEAGLKNINLQLCGSVMCDVEQELGVSLFIFCGQYSGESLRASAEGALEWVNISVIERINVVEDLRKLIPRAYTWRSEQGVFAALNYYDDEEGNLETRFFNE